VVLPLLQAEIVPPGWVTNEEFVAGYGAAQAVPGPLFTFAAYLGGNASAAEWLIAAGWALFAVSLPSFLNAAMVGLLLAALYDPVWKPGQYPALRALTIFVMAPILLAQIETASGRRMEAPIGKRS
jgi:chromate transporter